MKPEYIVYISLVVSLVANFVYIRETLLGRTKPDRASWFVWFLIPFIASFLVFRKGELYSALPIFISGFTSFLVFVSSFFNKNAYWKMDKIDISCLASAVIAIGFWLWCENTVWATFFTILAEFISFIPTYVKSWKFPFSENLSPYYSGLINTSLSLLVLKEFNFNTAGFAVSLFLMAFLEVVIIKISRRHIKSIN